MLIRGKSKTLVKQCLDDYCAAAGYNCAPRFFVLTKRGFGYALPSSLSGHPSLAFRLLLSLLAGQLTSLKLPLAANSLRVKNNIRIFFNSSQNGAAPWTAKVAVPSQHRSGSLRREIEVRHDMAKHETRRFALPKIVNYDSKNFTWLEEEFIKPVGGTRATEKVQLFLSEVGLQIYSVSSKSTKLDALLATIGLNATELDMMFGELGLDRKILNRNITAGIIHGDLSPENMIHGRDERLYMIDWELSQLAPIAWDLKKLYSYDNAGVLSLLEGLRHASDMNAREQMLVALCCQLVCLRRDQDMRFSYLTSNRNKTRATAQNMITKQDKSLVEWIEQLASN